MSGKKGYLKSFAKSGFFLHAALITAILLTLLVSSYEFKLFRTLMTQKHLVSYVSLIIAIFLVIGLLYLLVSLKISHISFADAVYLALILVGIFFAIYTAVYLKQFNVRRIGFSILTFTIGLLFLIIRVISFKKLIKKENSAPLNKVKSYFTEVINNYSMLGVVLAAGVTVCIAYIVLNITYGRRLKNDTYLIITSCCLLPLIAYGIRGALDKRVNLLDPLLLSGLISAPVVLIQILRVDYSRMRLTLWASIVCAYLIIYAFRFIRYDKSLAKKQIKPVCNCKIKGYYDAISSKHDPLLTLAIGGFIAAVALTLLKGQSINYYLIKKGVFNISLKGLPILVTLAASLGTLVFFAIVALIGIKIKRVTVGDFFLGVCFVFNLFGFATYFAYPSPLYLYLLIAFTAYCLIMTIARIVIINKEDD